MAVKNRRCRFHRALWIALVLQILAPSAALADPIDCTEGCNIVTCQDGYCVVWRCDANGCVEVGGYWQKEDDEILESESNGASKATASAVVVRGHGVDPDTECPRDEIETSAISAEAAFVRTCDGETCRLWGLKGRNAEVLGTFDDLSQAEASLIEAFLGRSDNSSDPR